MYFKSLSKYPSLVPRRICNLVKGNCSILLYHRIDNEERNTNLLTVRPDDFYDQLVFLKKKFHILSVQEFMAIVDAGKRFPDKSVLLTFDDGYPDNHLYARPILESLDLEAIFFISTGYVNSRKEFWWDKLEQIIFHSANEVGQKPLVFKENSFYLDNDQRKIAAFGYLNQALKLEQPVHRDQYIDTWAQAYHVVENRPTYCAMDWDTLKTFSKSKSVVIGAHTVSHAALRVLNQSMQEAEIVSSVTELQAKLGTAVNHFSFPYGTADFYEEQSLHICRENSLDYVFGGYAPLISDTSKDKTLSRRVVKPQPFQLFKKQMLSTVWWH